MLLALGKVQYDKGLAYLLRALHGLGLCRWRLGEFREAWETFRRIFFFDPLDVLGVRYLLPEVEEGRDYLAYVEKEEH